MIEFGSSILPARFWCRVQQTESCWLWTGGTIEGYGAYWLGGRNRGAHVVMYEAVHGTIPSGLFVCHRCDVRPCVNPSHLFLGTNQENTADKVAKGRQRGPAGELHGNSKLTESLVREIRAQRDAGARIVDIARHRQLHINTVSAICRRIRWSHVD